MNTPPVHVSPGMLEACAQVMRDRRTQPALSVEDWWALVFQAMYAKMVEEQASPKSL